MNRILIKRYAFCNFSSIAGFPNQVPTRDEWEKSLPRFRGEEWEVPAEHLLDFHEFIDQLEIIHEDVKIKLFKCSLKGIALHWCWSLPDASISSLADFHAAFHVFCNGIFPADLLYPECCHEFSLRYKDPNTQEKYVAAGDISHHDQQIADSHHDSHEDVVNIVSDSFIKEDCHDDQIVSFEIFKDDDQIFISENFEDVEQTNETTADSFRSAKVEEDSLPFSDLQGLFSSQLESKNHDQECVGEAYVLIGPYLPDLQTKTDCSRHLQEGQQKGSDQKFCSYVSPADLKQSTIINEFCGGNEEQLQHSELEQQLPEVFHPDFDDPFADFLESMSSIDLKIFLPEEDYLYHLFKPVFCMIWFSWFFGSRSSMMALRKFLTWLHWKHHFM